MKIPFKVKYGQNVIDIPVNGGKLYADNAAAGLSDLNCGVFTVVNQIPASETVPSKTAWKKHRIEKCDKKDGIFDKSSGQMFYRTNTWTAYIYDWQHYKSPLWTDGGYYALTREEQSGCFTVNIGDLLIFADIPDAAPKSAAEFASLRDKYKDCGGIITGCEVYINYKPNGEPWKTNHIEVIKA